MAEERRKEMNSTAKPAVSLRFPALPVIGLAGASFKQEHLSAILAEGGQRGFFEVHAEKPRPHQGKAHEEEN